MQDFRRLFFVAILSVFFVCIWGVSFGQEDCVPGSNPNLAPTTDGWIAHIYEYPVATKYPSLSSFPTLGEYKGILRDEYLPAGAIDFDTHFGGDVNNTDAVDDDEWHRNITDNSCLTRLSYFGAVFKGKYTIPSTGTYKISLTSDDGTVLKVNGATFHSQWARTVFDDANPSEYYITKVQGETLNLEILYFEYTVYNRISFKIERYYGPGVIASDQRISAINPDPAPFTSLAPAEFEVAGPIVYKWYYNNFDDPDSLSWTPIPNSNSVTYDIPPHDVYPDAFEGVRYYHRRATSGGITYISKAVEVDLCLVEPLDDYEQWGDKEWIGYVYSGYVISTTGGFNNADFLGRVKEPAIFERDFGGDRNYYPTFDKNWGPGCSFLTEGFSIRYKMKIRVTPGTYNYEVVGDDGFRLKIQDKDGNYLGVDPGVPSPYAIYNWTTGGATDERKREIRNNIVIDKAMDLYFTLEYFENIYGNYISFRHSGDPFSVLPLEWGQVSAEACGPDNCLTWETIQEKNTSHFELERSYNGVDWEMFDRSVQAQGNSTELKTYHFTDKRVKAGKVYYRIRQVDLDEAFAYSDVMRVDNPHYVKTYLPFPNPTTDKIRFFSATEVVGVSLLSNDYLLNTDLKLEKLHDNRYEVDLLGLKPGNYVIVVEKRNGERDIFKVIKK